jgi:uncharacterized protein YcbX
MDEILIDNRGFVHDRRLMIIDQNGNFLTQRSLPRLSLVHIHFLSPIMEIETLDSIQTLELSAPGMSNLTLTINLTTVLMRDIRSVRVWKSTVEAIDVGDEISQWFTTFLGDDLKMLDSITHVRIVYQPPSPLGHRVTNRDPTQQVSFADGYPILLTSMNSLEELNDKIMMNNHNLPVPMARFRPNIVISGLYPWSEDWFPTFTWTDDEGNIGILKMVKPCDRCKITTVIPQRGEYSGDGEPLLTLNQYRLRVCAGGGDTSVFFGVNLGIVQSAKLKRGQMLNVLWGGIEQ